jgi:hypothetical protein
MKFISIFTHEGPPKPPTPELMAQMGKLIEDGMKAGWLLATEGIQWGETPTRVRSDGGKVTVTDGPFAEAKEVLGGYALMQARSKEEIVELTRQFLKVAGDGICEIHQLYEAPAGGPPQR